MKRIFIVFVLLLFGCQSVKKDSIQLKSVIETKDIPDKYAERITKQGSIEELSYKAYLRRQKKLFKKSNGLFALRLSSG